MKILVDHGGQGKVRLFALAAVALSIFSIAHMVRVVDSPSLVKQPTITMIASANTTGARTESTTLATIQQENQQQVQQLSSKSTIKNKNKPPTTIQLNPSKYRLLHVGKDGGGSIRDRSARAWQLRIQQCHPAPCRRYFAPSSQNTIPASLLTLRDPVDRFVSAFYYRALRLDQGENCTLVVSKQRQCHERDRERELMFSMYQRNVNPLAEAFCNDNDKASAKKNASQIGFLLRHQLHNDWLPSQRWEKYQDRIFPLVLERGFDFVVQMDDAMEWLHQVEPIEDKTVFAQRQEFSRGKILNDPDKKAHSSSEGLKQENIPLSSKGAACLQEHYADDYRILKQIQMTTCKTQTCRDAIQSILDRRGIKK